MPIGHTPSGVSGKPSLVCDVQAQFYGAIKPIRSASKNSPFASYRCSHASVRRDGGQHANHRIAETLALSGSAHGEAID